MTCTSRCESVLYVQGRQILDRAGLTGPAAHVLRMDQVMADVHREVRRGERAEALGLAYERGLGPDPQGGLAEARRHALQARREFRTALASSEWEPILRGFDPARDDFVASLSEARTQLLTALNRADLPVASSVEISDAFDQVAEIATGQGVDGLQSYLDEQFGEAERVLTDRENFGRRTRSPLEWWQWLIIVGILVIAVAALVACLWWSGCSWITAVWAAFCVGTVAAGGFWAGICLGFGF